VARAAGELITDPCHRASAGGSTGKSRRARGAPLATLAVTVETLDEAGRGVVHIDGKRVLVEGALAGESIVCRPRRGRRQGQQADLVEVLEAAPSRVEPVCPHFGVCGGCRLQHMPIATQLARKQEGLLGALFEQLGLQPDTLLEPLTGASTHYRRRARLGVKYVPGKGGALVGFREKQGAKLAELDACVTLESRVGGEIKNLRRMIDKLDIRHRIPQVEVSMGDSDTALVLRHLDPLSEGDRRVLVEFVRQRNWQLYLQPGGPDSVQPLWPADPAPLSYRLAEFELEFEFLPADFIQINAGMNNLLVSAAVGHLDLRADSRVLDLFCGIGNFTLAIGRRAASVTGVEGSEALVSRARANASRNRVDNVTFVSADLSRVDGQQHWRHERWDRLLLDPPRSGAGEVLNSLGEHLPQRIVYVSCNPESLARDAGLLVHHKGFRLSHAGIIDMFPHTAHCEAMAVFERRVAP
jgi:23S rRNA (uracil1939-C5)-methyltransferase